MYTVGHHYTVRHTHWKLEIPTYRIRHLHVACSTYLLDEITAYCDTVKYTPIIRINYTKNYLLLGFQVLTVMATKSTITWYDVTSCSRWFTEVWKECTTPIFCVEGMFLD
jgi:hypothetical protein